MIDRLKLGVSKLFHQSFLFRFRQEQEAILRKKEEERRAQLAEKAKTRESYREKMSNAMRIDVSFFDCREQLLFK